MKKIIASVCATIMVLGSCASADGLTTQMNNVNSGVEYSKTQLMMLKAECSKLDNMLVNLREFTKGLSADFEYHTASEFTEHGFIWDSIFTLEKDLGSLNVDYNNNMDMIYADIDNLYCLLAEAQTGSTVGEIRDLESNIHALEEMIRRIPDNTDTMCQLILDVQNLYTLCNEQQAMIADLQEQINTMSAYVYG